MPNSGNTTEFPRKDNVYKKKESIPYDEHRSVVWKSKDDKPSKKSQEIRSWFVHALIGALIGITTFVMDIMEEFLVNQNRDWAQ